MWYTFWMTGNYICTTGVQLYRWYQMGITDPEDLQWLVEFYIHERYSISVMLFALQEARRYFER